MKKRFLLSFLLLLYICSLQVVYSDPRVRAYLDTPAYGSRIDLSHRLVRNLPEAAHKDIIACFLFNEGIGTSAWDIALNYFDHDVDDAGILPLHLEGAASPNDPEFDGNTGWRFRSTGGGTRATTSARKIRDTFTIAMWVMPTSLTVDGYILSGPSTAAGLYIIWYPTSGTFKGFAAYSGAFPGTPTWATSKRVADINKIHHVVVTAEVGGNTKLYVDNELQNLGLAKSTSLSPNWRLGSLFDNTAPVDMVIYSLYIWNTVLTATDVAELYLDPYCIIEEEVDGVGIWAAISDVVASRVIIVR